MGKFFSHRPDHGAANAARDAQVAAPPSCAVAFSARAGGHRQDTDAEPSSSPDGVNPKPIHETTEQAGASEPRPRASQEVRDALADAETLRGYMYGHGVAGLPCGDGHAHVQAERCARRIDVADATGAVDSDTCSALAPGRSWRAVEAARAAFCAVPALREARP